VKAQPLESKEAISIVIPTYNRERVLLETLAYIESQCPGPAEILVVDQTDRHAPETERALETLTQKGQIQWIRLVRPSITRAMNVGLLAAKSEVVLFADDDIVPARDWVGAHVKAHRKSGCAVVAGQVYQPWERLAPEDRRSSMLCRFSAFDTPPEPELMGGNFSVKRQFALDLGGFDENFVRAAYRFEADFSERVQAAGEKIVFEPCAAIKHLKTMTGGTRTFGEHLTTIGPAHCVGEYYYLLKSRQARHKWYKIFRHPFEAVKTRFHMKHPWWIPITLTAEVRGLMWAIKLHEKGPVYINTNEIGKGSHV
jgi:GT2 family glycosyltransferase